MTANRSVRRKAGAILKREHNANPSLKVLRIETDEATGKVRLQIRVPIGKKHLTIAFDRELLVDLPNFKKLLASTGASTKLDFQAEMDALSDPPADTPEVTIVRRALWDGKRFINCFGEFGPQSESNGAFEYDRLSKTYWKPTTRGDIESFVELLREALSASPTLLFAFLMALVPALMLYLGVTAESFVVAFTGQTTTGKSLSTRVVLSISSRAAEKDLKSMNLSVGLAGQLGGYSGTALTFGDIKASREKGKSLAEKLQTLVFGIVGGVVRETLDSKVSMPPEACAGVLSFEKPVVPFFEENGFELEDGDRVRILDVQVPDRDLGGIFELDPASASLLAKSVEDALHNHHGVVLPYWVDFLGKQNVERAHQAVLKFGSDFDAMVGPLSPLEARYMASVRWVYVAGRIALKSIKLKVVDRDTFESHFRLLTARLLKTFNAGDIALQATVAQVKKALVVSTTFTLVEKGQKADPEECVNGFRRMEAGKMCLFVRTDFIERITTTRNHERVLREFERNGALLRTPDESTSSVSQKGLKRARYLKFDRDQLERMSSQSAV